MAVDPVTLKLLLQAAVNVATDEESRRKVLAIVIGVVMFVIFLIVLPIYLLTSPLDALRLAFSGDELPQIELFRNENISSIVTVEPNIVFEGEYPLPVNNAVVTSGYGQRIDPITFEESFHLGIDFAGEWRSNITAVADGKIYAVCTDENSYGNYIIIRHDDFYSIYAHMSQIYIFERQEIVQGTVIGTMGGNPELDKNPGRSTGTHLHFEIRLSPYDNRCDPAEYLYTTPETEDNE